MGPLVPSNRDGGIRRATGGGESNNKKIVVADLGGWFENGTRDMGFGNMEHGGMDAMPGSQCSAFHSTQNSTGFLSYLRIELFPSSFAMLFTHPFYVIDV